MAIDARKYEYIRSAFKVHRNLFFKMKAIFVFPKTGDTVHKIYIFWPIKVKSPPTFTFYHIWRQ